MVSAPPPRVVHIRFGNMRMRDFHLILPGNRLEALRGERRGQHRIRINDQYRICFEWRDGDARNVEIVDYH